MTKKTTGGSCLFFVCIYFCNLSIIRTTAVSIRDLTCHFVIGSSHLWSMNTHCIPVRITSSRYILSSALRRDISSSRIGFFIGISYQPRHLPRPAPAIYLTVRLVIAFAHSQSQLPEPAFCSTRVILLTSALSTTATWPYGFDVVLSKNMIDPCFGTEVGEFSTRFHSVPTKGEPVCHHFRAEPENHLIGNQDSWANNLTSETHWCPNSFDSAYLFPIHLSNISFVVISGKLVI